MTEADSSKPAHSENGSPDVDLVPYRVLDTKNRRAAAAVYLVAAAAAAGAVLATGINLMWLTAVFPLVGIAVYQFIAGRHLGTSDMAAIELASDAAPFDVGHGSATLGFTGFTAKPVWQVLLFEAGAAPKHQALVTVDGLTGNITGTYAEPVPTP
jgi:hypothetical protein